MANECTLWVNGMIYGGWTAIRINRGIEQLAGSFTLSVTEKWPGQAEARPIKKGDSAARRRYASSGTVCPSPLHVWRHHSWPQCPLLPALG